MTPYIVYLATADARGHLMRAKLLVHALRTTSVQVDVLTSDAGQAFLAAFGIDAAVLPRHYAVQFDERHNMLRVDSDAQGANSRRRVGWGRARDGQCAVGRATIITLYGDLFIGGRVMGAIARAGSAGVRCDRRTGIRSDCEVDESEVVTCLPTVGNAMIPSQTWSDFRNRFCCCAKRA